MVSETTNNGETQATLQPFEGFIIPGIGFESGHIIWLFKFDNTPTPLGRHSSVWIESPTGKLSLYTDPPEAIEYSAPYHDFDQVVGASIDWTDADLDRIEVVMHAEDGTALGLGAVLDHPASTRIMEGLASLVPRAVQRSSAGAAVSSLSLNLLLDANGLKLRGTTETGARYWGEADHLRTVQDASATLDGRDLGKQIPASSSHDFGDVKTARKPYVVFGALHLEYPAQEQPV